MKTSFAFFALLSLSLYWSCSTKFLYTDIEKIPGEDIFEAHGFFSNDPIPMLVNDPFWLGINTPMPDSSYILLYGPGLNDILSNPDKKYYGASVTVRGTRAKGSKSIRRSHLNVQTVAIDSGAVGAAGPTIINHCNLYPSLCTLGRSSPNRYALLYSGGKIPAEAKIRFWNNLELMYLTLISKCGFAAENIFVVYKNGNEEYLGSLLDVRYEATSSDLNDAIHDLNLKMNDTTKDTLFIFVTNHGGGRYFAPAALSGAGVLLGGLADLSGDEPEPADPTDNTDETIFFYRNGTIIKSFSDDSWVNKWSTLLTAQDPFLISFYQQCFSGGFLKDMKQPAPALPTKRINIAAASEYGNSHGMPPDDLYDTFSYYFTLALLGHNLNGSPLSPSPDIPPLDGKISIWEAFLYARQNDPDPASGHENFIDDNGDGNGFVSPSTTLPLSGSNGFFSKSFYLKW